MTNNEITQSEVPVDATVLVTGGSGFVGGHVIVGLLNRGYRVHTTIRSLAREPEVRAMLGEHADTTKLTFFAADLLHDGGWDEAASGAKYVLHVASPMPVGEYRDRDVIAPAREGTRRVLEAAQRAGVSRVVVTSSTAAAMAGPGGPEILDESVWTDLPAKPQFDYQRAKTFAEQDAWAFVKDRGQPFELVTILPGQIQGPVLGADYSPTINVVRMMLAGKLPMVPRVGYNIVDIRDLADLHILAMTRSEAAGQRIIASSDFLTFKDVADIIRGSLGKAGRKAPRWTLPDFVVRFGGVFNSEMRALVPNLGQRFSYTNARAERLLGRKLRSGREATLASANSLLAYGLV